MGDLSRSPPQADELQPPATVAASQVPPPSRSGEAERLRQVQGALAEARQTSPVATAAATSPSSPLSSSMAITSTPKTSSKARADAMLAKLAGVEAALERIHDVHNN